MREAILLDGSYGEGGGQILRTALALAALTGRPFRVQNIRAGRENPGLRPQHLAAVRAVAHLCDAETVGDAVGSRELLFAPRSAPCAGEYTVDVSAIAGEGSAGSVTLLLQTLFLPLAFAAGDSVLTLRGGTHVRWSPPYHYLAEVWLPLMEHIGFSGRLELGPWGWYPRGGGEITAHIQGGMRPEALRGIERLNRGRLVNVWGFSAASNLPAHIAERQRSQVLARLASRHIRADIACWAPASPGPGTAVFLLAEYEAITAGFTGYGRLRYPAEKVADDAFEAFDDHRRSGMAFDPHLADQAILPLALAPNPSRFTTSRITAHLTTVAWVVKQFLPREILIDGAEGAPGQVTIR
ncbi:MAG: RNA 3'-phosphate cyclase [Chloroflexi bacterium]|nr:RNA 3'-phosphate cyclase [Chloroflexota bacterium]MBC7316076.1 RNA 3'-phosphate cyclase [Chloroflexota bacterium]